jgi:16S rRNA (guanine527-N7)-methyltransferase
LTRTAGWSFFLSVNSSGGSGRPSAAARLIFGEVLPTAQLYAGLLTGPGVERGLIGPDEASRIWDRHLLNCAVVAELVPDSGQLADLGSGAGLPGLVLAMLRPNVEVLLVEPMARRTTFLAECVRELGLANVRVERGRAEDMVGTIRADVVTARAVARLDRLAILAAGLTRPGGQVLAIKGANAARELAEATPVLARLGASEAKIVSLGAGVLASPTTVVSFVAGAAMAGGGERRAAGGGERPAEKGSGVGSSDGRAGRRRENAGGGSSKTSSVRRNVGRAPR